MLPNVRTGHRRATTNKNPPACNVSVEVDFGSVLVLLSPVFISCVSAHCADSFSIAIFPSVLASPLPTSAPRNLACPLATVILLPPPRPVCSATVLIPLL